MKSRSTKLLTPADSKFPKKNAHTINWDDVKSIDVSNLKSNYLLVEFFGPCGGIEYRVYLKNWLSEMIFRVMQETEKNISYNIKKALLFDK